MSTAAAVEPAQRASFAVPHDFGPIDAAHAADATQRASAPSPADDPPPTWLRPEQVGPFRAALASVRAFGGALVATPVGSGKSYVGLAICRALDHKAGVDIVVPAILVPQWRHLTATLAVPCRLTSHEAVSRGARLTEGGPVLIDESHRFRNPATRRFRELAPQLIGRCVVLLTATPIVNRRDDLLVQLSLAVSDDALVLYGIPSLRQSDQRHDPTLPLLIRQQREFDRPWRRETVVRGWAAGDQRRSDTLVRIDRLGLSKNRAVATLIRNGLLRALASSPAALAASLNRYLRLLGHAADARLAGHPLNRSAILSVVAEDVDQLVMWDLLDLADEAADLAIGDRPVVDRLVRQVRDWIYEGDAKSDRLSILLADGKPTLVFTTYQETVHYLRRRLAHLRVAWLTGSSAGYQHRRMSRSLVLQSFDPLARAHHALPATSVLLATDVAAEGLNLRSAARVVHYDLPWTPMRLEQRDGRAIRPGSAHRDIDVVRFELPEDIEARIHLELIVQRKRAASVIAAGSPFAGGPLHGWCSTIDRHATACLRLRDAESGATGLLILVRQPSSAWQEATTVPPPPIRFGPAVPEPVQCEAMIASLDAPVRSAIARRSALRIATVPIAPVVLGLLISAADRFHRSRDHGGLAQIERVLRFLRRGHTAGEAMLVERLARGDQAALAEAAHLGDREPPGGILTAELLLLAVPTDH